MDEISKLLKQVNEGTLPPVEVSIDGTTIVNLCLAIAVAGILIITISKILK